VAEITKANFPRTKLQQMRTQHTVKST